MEQFEQLIDVYGISFVIVSMIFFSVCFIIWLK